MLCFSSPDTTQGVCVLHCSCLVFPGKISEWIDNHMQPTTRKLAVRVQQALLALTDEMLFELISYWLATINDLSGDTEILASYHESLGYRIASVASGQAYDSVEALDEAEPDAEDIRWIPPDPSHLREVVRRKQPKEVYHHLIALAGEALRQEDFAAQWAEPPGEQSDGYGFMRSLERYLTLRKEAGSEGIEQFEAQYAEQLAACADAFPGERTEVFENLPDLLMNERAVHFRVTMSAADEQQQVSLLQALQQCGCVFSPSVEAKSIEGSVFYVPGRQTDLKTLARVRRLLNRWQRVYRITWTEEKEKPPRRLPHTKHKQKTRGRR